MSTFFEDSVFKSTASKSDGYSQSSLGRRISLDLSKDSISAKNNGNFDFELVNLAYGDFVIDTGLEQIRFSRVLFGKTSGRFMKWLAKCSTVENPRYDIKPLGLSRSTLFFVLRHAMLEDIEICEFSQFLDLLKAGIVLESNSILHCCCRILAKRIDERSSFDLGILVEDFKDEEIEYDAEFLSFCVKYLPSIHGSIEKVPLPLLLAILKSDDVRMEEYQIFLLIQRWVSHRSSSTANPLGESRLSKLRLLLGCLRLDDADEKFKKKILSMVLTDSLSFYRLWGFFDMPDEELKHYIEQDGVSELSYMLEPEPAWSLKGRREGHDIQLPITSRYLNSTSDQFYSDKWRSVSSINKISSWISFCNFKSGMVEFGWCFALPLEEQMLPVADICLQIYPDRAKIVTPMSGTVVKHRMSYHALVMDGGLHNPGHECKSHTFEIAFDGSDCSCLFKVNKYGPWKRYFSFDFDCSSFQKSEVFKKENIHVIPFLRVVEEETEVTIHDCAQIKQLLRSKEKMINITRSVKLIDPNR